MNIKNRVETMRDEIIEDLRMIPLFTDIGIESLRHLTHGALLQRFPRGTELFPQGEQPDFLHVLIDGSVELYAESEGRETVMEILTPVEVFILAAVLTDRPYLMSARVQDDARLLLLPAEPFREALESDPRLGMIMLASLAGQFRGMVRQLKSLKLRTASQRLGCYLLRLMDGRGPQVELPYRKAILASQLGVTPEALSRAFHKLAAHGVLVQGQMVTIADPAALARYCLPDELMDPRVAVA